MNSSPLTGLLLTLIWGKTNRVSRWLARGGPGGCRSRRGGQGMAWHGMASRLSSVDSSARAVPNEMRDSKAFFLSPPPLPSLASVCLCLFSLPLSRPAFLFPPIAPVAPWTLKLFTRASWPVDACCSSSYPCTRAG
ncbi:hypothetical protein DL95DRAFT_393064 [Leptodontidium sp. 2 PMI_412]|nr:hypothetical protein DL95DRAFT_393064 [Leptodontidium sp. 2 PMI_412]